MKKNKRRKKMVTYRFDPIILNALETYCVSTYSNKTNVIEKSIKEYLLEWFEKNRKDSPLTKELRCLEFCTDFDDLSLDEQLKKLEEEYRNKVMLLKGEQWKMN